MMNLTTADNASARERFFAPRWHEGHWIHDRHYGRLGWWWVVGPAWTFYPQPFVPRTVIVEQAPPPQVTVIQQPQSAPVAMPPAPPIAAPSPVLYYCKATGTYYPETMSCPGGWSTHTASTPPVPPTGPPAAPPNFPASSPATEPQT